MDASHTRGGSNSNVPSKRLVQRLVPFPTDDMKVHWARRTLVLTLVVTILCAACQSWIMINQTQKLKELLAASTGSKADEDIWQKWKTELTYHSVFLASIFFGLYVTWDGVMNQNTLEIIATNFYYAGMLGYAIAQIFQVLEGRNLIMNQSLLDGSVGTYTGIFLAALLLLPILLGIHLPVFAVFARYLNRDFDWRMYRITGGEIDMTKYFSAYHVTLLLLKFDAFFVSAFTVIDLVLTRVSARGIIVIPSLGAVVGIAAMLTGYYGIRYELRISLFTFLSLMLVIIGYIIQRLYEAFVQEYDQVQRIKIPYLFYAVVSMALSVACFLGGVRCWWNFGKGLKTVLDQESKRKDGVYAQEEMNLDE
ncbi:hypothetical protein HDU81_007134 [Chytriomyces hyalinus]|nr:hypothetical protein HDU81_007134 [Chytriomyces hyalinus]